MNLMLINVSTRKLRRAVRLPESDLPVIAGDGTSKAVGQTLRPRSFRDHKLTRIVTDLSGLWALR
jgi:hypothetical protein